ncbi:YbhB/YbcL family Raf kinase inhibitor-like protein [Vibrio neptunius]|uniref:YbhB/YbcL family Raf kinase inhibitor-like protein n=1 Tax=Vibrio neptunius TaxID=170651 RepID=A0ABS3A5K6_9VIBR|nr:YbhB/YbcL family Raf kinase inhibitor-like protein [Vibrio neptunius]MBN3494335.1 YbhB/YbcL family Raf kinase inhibitor-like protein [Vibrio neptunius]MBN3516739.1 YbhB/YbcL family Raf kinase inhibitor-like protein [Vibrio neptunius]MBN3551007.1 YbhB/YbcL family Raf kinase inhibitor-like protein [Vibrio neptunius]MBN3579076.1 YbhB/YbcL family Raf kinase inhibitor-like protein [Vibrio neptunius]MCH9872740.1 YbhB/YbcL family Raf kinase inhibitor-like protein [Vibrio neptunius]
MKATTLALMTTGLMLSGNTFAFVLTSQDIQEGYPMEKTFEFSGWGCSGDNLSPQLSWNNAPKGTKSFAITAYDPDAPTESGFWHWIALDIPASVNQLPRGADISKLGGLETRIDYGTKGFGGACPPVGDGMHRYQFTVWALPKAKLELGEDTPAAVVGFTLNSIAIAKTTLTATYTR